MRNLSIKLWRIYVCYTNITSYDVIYSVRYYLRFHITAVGLRTYYPWIWRSTCIGISIQTCSHTAANLLKLVLTCMGNEHFHCLGVHHCWLLCGLMCVCVCVCIYIYIYIYMCIFILCFVDLATQYTRVVPKVMSNFFLQANWEQQTKKSMVVDGTSCCVILEFLWRQ